MSRQDVSENRYHFAPLVSEWSVLEGKKFISIGTQLLNERICSCRFFVSRVEAVLKDQGNNLKSQKLFPVAEIRTPDKREYLVMIRDNFC